MATDDERAREFFLSKAVENIPRGFLEDFLRRAPGAYRDKFQEVRHDPTTLLEQRLPKLIQDRVFRMDWELAESAKLHGLAATSKPLPENGWAYTYVVAGTFGLTQSYVPTIHALPKPAKFRDGLAKAAGVPRLPFDDPEEIYRLREMYALLANNPIGKRFDEADQQMGSLHFCIPSKGMNAWAFTMSVPELLSHYPAVEKKVGQDRAAPAWKQIPTRKDGST